MPKQGNTAFVHIGMHKTGSTSIQMSFDRFESDSLVYPSLGNANHSAILSTIFKHAPETYAGHRRNKRTREDVLALRKTFVERLDAAIAAAGPRNMLLSGEDFVLMEASELADLRAYFLDRFAAVKVIGYVRSPASYMASAFQQRIVGGIRSDIAALYPEYRELFEKFDVVFGQDDVTLVKFDRAELAEGNVVIDLARRIGVEFDPARIVESNVGLSLESAAVLLAHRRYGAKELESRRDRIDNQRVASTIGGIGKSKLKLHKVAVRPVIAAKRDDMDWIEARLGTSLAEDLTSDDKAVTSVDEMLRMAGLQLPAMARILAEALRAARNDPVLLAKSVDLLYEAYACQRKQKRQQRNGAGVGE